MAKDSNIIITGTGGQGVMTLLDIAATAAMVEGYDVKSSELHGLSQRGGTTLTYLKFGDKIYSPLFGPGQADLILGLELLEALRATTFSNKKTTLVVNKKLIPFEGAMPEGNILVALNEATKANLYLVGASEICQKELGKEVVSGIYLLGYASFNKLINLKPTSIIKAIEKIVPQKYLDLNLKAFNLANSK
jgi:indolepyruvate ferredoxin oxidoreductase beta subunit